MSRKSKSWFNVSQLTCSAAALDVKHLVPVEEDPKHHDELVEALAEDVLHHGGGYQRRGPTWQQRKRTKYDQNKVQ